MSRRGLLGAAAALGLAALALVAWQRRRPELPPPAPSRVLAAPREFPPLPSFGAPRKSSRPRAPRPPSDENFALHRALTLELMAQASVGTPREAFLRILRDREQTPKDFAGRVRRALSLSRLPALVALDASLRAEAVAYLEGPALDDADALSRFAASAALLDCPLLFAQKQADFGLFLPEFRNHEGAWTLTPATSPELFPRLLQVFAREPDWLHRQFLAQRLPDFAGEAAKPFLRDTTTGDANEEVRYWAMDGLTKLPADGAGRAAILAMSERDPSERNRQSALIGLVESGYADDLVASRLATIENKSRAVYEAIGQAHRISGSPLLQGLLRQDLESADPRRRSMAIEGIAAGAPSAFAAELRAAAERESDAGLQKRLRELLEAPTPGLKKVP